MAVKSMTGFARASAALGSTTWQWEVRSINGKGLDLRLRLPPGYERLEIACRQRLTTSFKRGTISVSLTVNGGETGAVVRINEPVLDQVVALAERLREQLGGPPLQVEALLALRGVVEVEPPAADASATETLDAAMLQSLETAIADLHKMRDDEGQRIRQGLTEQLARIEQLAATARDHPGRRPEAIRQRLKEQVARLVEGGASLDPDRLHQEAVLLATRADIQEEIDRLFSHVKAASEIIGNGEAAGRKLDFLSQEFNREANTLCSKAGDYALSSIGLELKSVIDQIREQVQNIE